MTEEKKQILYKWFEMKFSVYDKLEYDKLEYDNSIYFYNDGKEYADIRIDKKFKKIYYEWNLYVEFSDIIPLKYFEFEVFLRKWFEDTFGLKGFTPSDAGETSYMLKIPK